MLFRVKETPPARQRDRPVFAASVADVARPFPVEKMIAVAFDLVERGNHEGPQSAILQGKNKVLNARIYQAMTGSPVHILAAAIDDFDDDPDACPKFVQALPALTSVM